MAPRRKKAVKEEERRTITVQPRLLPLYGVEFHDKHMRAFTAFGRTPAEAGFAARAVVQRHYPSARFDVVIEPVNPDIFAKTGVSLEPDESV